MSNHILPNSLGGVRVPLLELHPLMGLLPIPWITDEEIWAMSRMVINRRKSKGSEKNMSPVPSCQPQIQPGLPWDQTQTSTVKEHDLLPEV
jgi:hypothetical protein